MTFRPSFVAHVFFNDDEVDIANASEDRPSYAGTFALLGHQRCVGDAVLDRSRLLRSLGS
jgi:hypothetical protein